MFKISYCAANVANINETIIEINYVELKENLFNVF